MRYYVVTYRRFIGGIKRPSIITSIEYATKETSAEAMREAYQKAVSRMSSDWSVELVEISNQDYLDAAMDIDDFSIWMLTGQPVKEGA
jgi:hypothetical protein